MVWRTVPETRVLKYTNPAPHRTIYEKKRLILQLVILDAGDDSEWCLIRDKILDAVRIIKRKIKQLFFVKGTVNDFREIEIQVLENTEIGIESVEEEQNHVVHLHFYVSSSNNPLSSYTEKRLAVFHCSKEFLEWIPFGYSYKSRLSRYSHDQRECLGHLLGSITREICFVLGGHGSDTGIMSVLTNLLEDPNIKRLEDLNLANYIDKITINVLYHSLSSLIARPVDFTIELCNDTVSFDTTEELGIWIALDKNKKYMSPEGGSKFKIFKSSDSARYTTIDCGEEWQYLHIIHWAGTHVFMSREDILSNDINRIRMINY